MAPVWTMQTDTKNVIIAVTTPTCTLVGTSAALRRRGASRTALATFGIGKPSPQHPHLHANTEHRGVAGPKIA